MALSRNGRNASSPSVQVCKRASGRIPRSEASRRRRCPCSAKLRERLPFEVVSERTARNKETGKLETTTEKRLYISSLPVDPDRALMAVRAHWGIENRQYWAETTFEVAKSGYSKIHRRRTKKRTSPECSRASAALQSRSATKQKRRNPWTCLLYHLDQQTD